MTAGVYTYCRISIAEIPDEIFGALCQVLQIDRQGWTAEGRTSGQGNLWQWPDFKGFGVSVRTTRANCIGGQRDGILPWQLVYMDRI